MGAPLPLLLPLRSSGVRLRMNTRGYSADQSLMSDPARECSCMSIHGLRAFDRVERVKAVEAVIRVLCV